MLSNIKEKRRLAKLNRALLKVLKDEHRAMTLERLNRDYPTLDLSEHWANKHGEEPTKNIKE